MLDRAPFDWEEPPRRGRSARTRVAEDFPYQPTARAVSPGCYLACGLPGPPDWILDAFSRKDLGSEPTAAPKRYLRPASSKEEIIDERQGVIMEFTYVVPNVYSGCVFVRQVIEVNAQSSFG